MHKPLTKPISIAPAVLDLAKLDRCWRRYKVKMKSLFLSTLFVLFSSGSHATTLASAASKDYFENECITEVNARKQQSLSSTFCSAYIMGFLDGANNPKGCEIKDLTYFIERFVSYSQKQESKYFGIVVKSFVANSCKVL